MQIGNAIVCSYNPTHSLCFPHYPDYTMLLLTMCCYKNARGHNQSCVLNIRLSLKRKLVPLQEIGELFKYKKSEFSY